MGDTHAIPSMDALLPSEMAVKAEAIGVRKVQSQLPTVFILSILAGAFIALGAVFATTVVTGAGEHLPFGVTRLLSGIVFSTGLILVIVSGAELFTGNNLIVMAWANRRIAARDVLLNWLIVYLGNFVGAIATALMVFGAGQYKFGHGEIGVTALNIAVSKCRLDFMEAICLGILCNALVCLAVWMTFSARSTADKVLVIVPPIAAFVAAGFEHSVANMYFIPIGLMIRWWAPDSFWESTGTDPTGFHELTSGNFLVTNLFPVTLGNIIGGAVMVGIVYWFVYLRPRRTIS